MLNRSANAIILSWLATSVAVAQAGGISYQGRLETNGAPANGSFDFVFRLCSSAGPGGILQTFPPAGTVAVTVTDGLFTRTLTFDTLHFSGADRFLEVEVEGA